MPPLGVRHGVGAALLPGAPVRAGLLLASAALLLAACSSDRPRKAPPALPPPVAAPADPMVADNIEVGPIIDGTNYSKGVPVRPAAHPEGWSIEFGEPHYVTFRHGPLTGKSRVVLRFRLEGEPGTVLAPPCCPGFIGLVTLYFAARDNDWRQDGGRWWASSATLQAPTVPGAYEIVAPIDGPWSSVTSMTSASDPAAFARALANADRVGFTLGGGDGLGHGLAADRPTRMVVTYLGVE